MVPRIVVIALALSAIGSISVPILYGHFFGPFFISERLYIKVFLFTEGQTVCDEYTLVLGAELRDFALLFSGDQIKSLDNGTRGLKHKNMIFLSKDGKMSVVEKKPLC